LLVNADSDYVSKAMQAIKDTMLGNPAALCVKTLEYLNATNAILSKENAQLVATARSRQQATKGKQHLGKARKKGAAIAKRIAMGQKKKEQALKKTQKEAEKAERAHQRAVARDARAEMTRMAKIDKRLFV
jgi:hypothetical protein